MPVPDSRRRANDKYNAKCGRLELRPLREDVEAIRAAAAAAGQSLQGYILQAVRERMERDKLPQHYTLEKEKLRHIGGEEVQMGANASAEESSQ